VNSYQVTLPCSAAPQAGAVGSINHLTIPPTSCTSPGAGPRCTFDGFATECDGAELCMIASPETCASGVCVPFGGGFGFCLNAGQCAAPSPFIDTTRPDWVFNAHMGSITTSTDAGACPGTAPRLSSNIAAGMGMPVPLNTPKYLGSFKYRVGGCAVGDFSIVVQSVSNPAVASDATRMRTSTNALVTLTPVGQTISPLVAMEFGQCCDGNNNCLGDFREACCLHGQGGRIWVDARTCQGPTPNDCQCTQNSHCDDGNACTDNLCAPFHPETDSVGCYYPSNIPPGYCCDETGAGPLLAMDDGNECTADSCASGGYPVVHNAAANNGLGCASDGDPCTADTCSNGTCIHDAAAANGSSCPDEPNACTVDVCFGGVCQHDAAAANGQSCQGDGNECTLDVCSSGSCTHPNINSMPCETVADCPSGAMSCSGSPGNVGFCVCVPTGGPCFGDVAPPGGNGVVDLDDILCLLDGFAEEANCPNGDLVPCGGNGTIDLDDILAVLDAFAGDAACGSPCG